MYKNILQQIEHIAIWPVISFLIFFLFFVCLLWWVIRVDKSYVVKMKGLPLDDKSEESINS